jgi:HAD superfamily hydrolase (TIGR01509 family)
MNPPPRFHAVIFDMDGLMLDTEVMSRGIWQKAAGELGHTIPDELFARFIGRREEDCVVMLKELWGADFSFAPMHDRIVTLWAETMANHPIPRKAGLLELIDFIDSLGIPKAVATSSRRDNALAKLGELASRFKVMVTGEEVTRGKPEPDIFRLAAHRLGMRPADCLVLEDSWPGVQAANAAGMYAIMVPDLGAAHKDAAHICASLHEVEVWLQGHLA